MRKSDWSEKARGGRNSQTEREVRLERKSKKWKDKSDWKGRQHREKPDWGRKNETG